MLPSKKCQDAAGAFLLLAAAKCNGDIHPLRAARALRLITAAFHLYEEGWVGYDIGDWKWPAATLLPGSDARVSASEEAEPWTVLLRHAVAMLKEEAP